MFFHFFSWYVLWDPASEMAGKGIGALLVDIEPLDILIVLLHSSLEVLLRTSDVSLVSIQTSSLVHYYLVSASS